MLLFRHFGSICRRYECSYRRSCCRCSVCRWRLTETQLLSLFVAGRWSIEKKHSHRRHGFSAFVCVCVCVRARTHTHTHTRTHANMHTRTLAPTHTHAHTHTHARTHISTHSRTGTPTAVTVQVVAVRWVAVRPTLTKLTRPFSPVPLATNGRSVLHSNKHSRVRRVIRDSFRCFSRIKKLLGRTETPTCDRMCFQTIRTV